MFVLLLLCVAGCVTTTSPTGVKSVALDPNTGLAIQQGLDVAAGATTGVSAIWPWMVPVSMIITAIAGVWRKTNPVLAQATSEQQKYYDVTQGIVTAIESFKEAAPTEWEKLSTQLDKTLGPEAINVIRALRNLPPKV